MPTSIGNLVNLYWLDLAGNKLSGCIPVSGESTPGLNMLLNAKHFHFGNNMLSCEIPPQLFSSDMSLTHLLLEGNQLTGSIPSTLGLMQTLEVVRLDKNSLSGPVPDSLTHLISINHLYLANNQLDGPIPDLTGMKSLNYVDMSNNSFSPTDIPAWFSSLRSLTTLIMENTQLRGNLPTDLFSHDELQTVILKNNGIKGTLTIGSLHSTQLKLIDLQNNSFDGFTEQANAYDFQIVLADNPICKKRGTKKYCTIFQPDNIFISTGKRFVCYSIVFIYNIVLLLTSGPRGDNVYLNEKVDTLYVTQMTELYNQCDQLYLRSTLSHL